jgi:DNA-directed RNA polymerase subunit RPC12/RpoP
MDINMNIVCEVCGDILYGDGQDGETTTGEMCQHCQQKIQDDKEEEEYMFWYS